MPNLTSPAEMLIETIDAVGTALSAQLVEGAENFTDLLATTGPNLTGLFNSSHSANGTGGDDAEEQLYLGISVVGLVYFTTLVILCHVLNPKHSQDIHPPAELEIFRRIKRKISAIFYTISIVGVWLVGQLLNPGEALSHPRNLCGLFVATAIEASPIFIGDMFNRVDHKHITALAVVSSLLAAHVVSAVYGETSNFSKWGPVAVVGSSSFFSCLNYGPLVGEKIGIWLSAKSGGRNLVHWKCLSSMAMTNLLMGVRAYVYNGFSFDGLGLTLGLTLCIGGLTIDRFYFHHMHGLGGIIDRLGYYGGTAGLRVANNLLIKDQDHMPGDILILVLKAEIIWSCIQLLLIFLERRVNFSGKPNPTTDSSIHTSLLSDELATSVDHSSYHQPKLVSIPSTTFLETITRGGGAVKKSPAETKPAIPRDPTSTDLTGCSSDESLVGKDSPQPTLTPPSATPELP